MTKRQTPNNLNFIATYLFHNPGAGYTEILTALCKWKGKEYRPGTYTSYLSVMGGWRVKYHPDYRGELWHKMGPAYSRAGYLLTLKGMSRVIPDMNMERQHG